MIKFKDKKNKVLDEIETPVKSIKDLTEDDIIENFSKVLDDCSIEYEDTVKLCEKLFKKRKEEYDQWVNWCKAIEYMAKHNKNHVIRCSGLVNN